MSTAANSQTPPVSIDPGAKQQTDLQAIRHFLDGKGVKEKFEQMLGKRAPQFITSVMQIIASSKDLQKADINSIYNAAATAAVLDLPLNNNLQFAAIVPYKDTKRGTCEAQLQVMWKGIVQLAQRSGQYETINVTDVRKGELKSRDRLSGDCIFEWEQDEEKRQQLPIIGFVSYFKLINGFKKPLFRTEAELKAHAKKYSKTYDRQDGKWNTDFDAMCAKTVIKENLSKWGPLSIDMALAFQADQAVVKSLEEGKFEYPDNPIQDAQEISEDEAAEIARTANEQQARDAEKAMEEELLRKKQGGSKK